MAGESVVITWSVANWITVTIMVLLSFMVLGLGSGIINKARAKNNATN